MTQIKVSIIPFEVLAFKENPAWPASIQDRHFTVYAKTVEDGKRKAVYELVRDGYFGENVEEVTILVRPFLENLVV